MRSHGNTVGRAIRVTRNWLRTARPHYPVPGADVIITRYLAFLGEFPRMCREQGVDRSDPPFLDYRMVVIGWLVENP